MVWNQRCIRCGECLDHCAQGAIVKVTGADDTIGFLTNRNRCNLCGECVEICTADAREMVGRRVSVNDVMREIERDRAFFEESGGGVTFSGGEPTAQANFLRALLQACRKVDLHTAVDTSGYTPLSVLESILPFTDLFLYDVKMMDDSLHRKYTGVPNGLILTNLETLSSHEARIIIRMPVIPGINDTSENLRQFAEFASSLPSLERIDLLPYHSSATGKYERLEINYALHHTKTPTEAAMQQIARFFEPYQLPVTIGG